MIFGALARVLRPGQLKSFILTFPIFFGTTRSAWARSLV